MSQKKIAKTKNNHGETKSILDNYFLKRNKASELFLALLKATPWSEKLIMLHRNGTEFANFCTFLNFRYGDDIHMGNQHECFMIECEEILCL